MLVNHICLSQSRTCFSRIRVINLTPNRVRTGESEGRWKEMWMPHHSHFHFTSPRLNSWSIWTKNKSTSLLKLSWDYSNSNPINTKKKIVCDINIFTRIFQILMLLPIYVTLGIGSIRIKRIYLDSNILTHLIVSFFNSMLVWDIELKILDIFPIFTWSNFNIIIATLLQYFNLLFAFYKDLFLK